MARIDLVTHEAGNCEQKSLLEAIQAQFGMVPNFLKVFANSPDALKSFLGRHAIANGGRLDPQTKIPGKPTRVEIDFPKIRLSPAA